MAESSFTETVHTLRAKIGWNRGFRRDYSTMDDNQKDEIEEILVSGLRNFYWPKSGYIWSFMRPTGSVATIAGTWQYEQQGDFGGIEGDLTYVTTSTSYWKVPITGESVIRDLRAVNPTMTGAPRKAAIRPVAKVAEKGQRFELLFWPTPDAVYTLEFIQIVNPNILTDANPFPYGGPIHAETILESCLAVGEARMDDNPGNHASRFTELLAASIELDGQLTRAENLGPNLDRSGRPQVMRDRSQVTVLYNGTQW